MLRVDLRHDYGAFALRAGFETEALVTAVFGPSGSGKTTIIEAIAGTRRVGGGRIRLDDTTWFDSESKVCVPANARGVGVVFQDQLLFPHMSVSRNLRYGLRNAAADGRPRVELDRVVELLELGPVLQRRPGGLSGGERQRVALGRALLSRPRLLLMDEPLTALDDRLKMRILGYLDSALEAWAIPTVFVSHSQAEVRRLAQRVVLMDGGRVVSAGPPEETLAAPEAMGLKDRAGPMNLLRLDGVYGSEGRLMGTVAGQTLHLPPTESAPAGEVYVQFAPDTVLLSREDLARVSARNHLRGVVRHVAAIGDACFVGVDIGQIVWAEVTPGAVAELGLVEGAEVFCLIKTHSLRVVS